MNNHEAKEHRRGLLGTALLRDHVRKLLLNPDLDLKEWREEAVKLFDAKHWWDLDGRNVTDNLKGNA